MHTTSRATFAGSRLVHLLAELELLSGQPTAEFAQRLGRLFDLSDTVTLDAANAHHATGPFHAGANDHQRRQADLIQVRDKLIVGIRHAFEPDQLGTRSGLPAPSADFEPYRSFHVARQRQLTAGLQPVRVRLRGALADASPAAAQLAELDAVFDATLAAYARQSFGVIPKLLARRFETLKPEPQRGLMDEASDDLAAWVAPGGWLHRFAQEMRLLLLAELEVRLEPLWGLLNALHKEVHDHT